MPTATYGHRSSACYILLSHMNSASHFTCSKCTLHMYGWHPTHAAWYGRTSPRWFELRPHSHHRKSAANYAGPYSKSDHAIHTLFTFVNWILSLFIRLPNDILNMRIDSLNLEISELFDRSDIYYGSASTTFVRRANTLASALMSFVIPDA